MWQVTWDASQDRCKGQRYDGYPTLALLSLQVAHVLQETRELHGSAKC